MNKRLIGGVLIISSLIAGIWALMPSTFTANTKVIGQGKPAIVVIFDSRDSASVNLKYGYQKISAEYEETVEFVLVNILSSNGIHFLQNIKAEAGTALYYDGAGNQLKVLQGPKDVNALNESIKTTFDI